MIDPQQLKDTFGAAVRECREAKGLSQERLAAATGRHWTIISRIERGRNLPNVLLLFEIAQALEIEASTIVQRAEEHLHNL